MAPRGKMGAINIMKSEPATQPAADEPTSDAKELEARESADEGVGRGRTRWHREVHAT